MSQREIIRRLTGALGALVLVLGLCALAVPASAQSSCYPPTPDCGTTTTSEATTTTVGSTTTSQGPTTTTCTPRGNGNGNAGCGNNGNGNGGGGGNNGNGNGNGGDNRMKVDDTTLTPGQGVRITADPGTFRPGSSGLVTIQSVERQLGTFTAAEDGSVTTVVSIPEDLENGAHTLFLKGTGADGNPLSLSRSVTVYRVESRGSIGPLPRTGVLLLVPAVLLGLGLVAAGLVARRGGRRLRPRTER